MLKYDIIELKGCYMIKLSSLTKDYYKPKEVCDMLNISIYTLYNREKQGIIKADKTISNRRIYSRETVIFLLSEASLLYEDDDRYDVIYARVSTYRQKQSGDLQRQIDTISSTIVTQNPKNLQIITDIGSGLNDNRKGLKKLIRKILNHEIHRVFITYQDRLTRFGFHMIQEICDMTNTKIVILCSDETDISAEEELVNDIISLMHSFSGKLYGLRRQKLKHMFNEVFKDDL